MTRVLLCQTPTRHFRACNVVASDHHLNASSPGLGASDNVRLFENALSFASADAMPRKWIPRSGKESTVAPTLASKNLRVKNTTLQQCEAHLSLPEQCSL